MSKYLVTYEVAESKISDQFHSFHTTFVEFEGDLPTEKEVQDFLDEATESESLLPLWKSNKEISIICMQKLAD